jgi:O-antigen/teichoic acid export membrane protein
MDFDKILSDSLVSAVRSILFILRGIILIPIITKTAGADTYGIWTTAIALIGIVTTVGGFHLYGALIRYAQQDRPVREVTSELYTLTLVLTGIVAACYVLIESVFGFDLAGIGQASSSGFLFLLAAIALAKGGFIVLRNAPRATGQVKLYEKIQMAWGLLEALVLGAVFYFVGSVSVALVALLLIFIFLNLLLGVKYLSGFRLPSVSSFKQYFGYGAPMFPREVASSLIQHADKVLILYFLSPTAVGVYAVVYSVTKLPQTLAGTLNSTLYPTVSSLWEDAERDSLVQLYDQINRWAMLLGLPATVGVVLIAEPAIRLLSTPEVATAGVGIVPILAVGFAISGYSKPLVYVLTAAEETTRLGGVNVFAAVLNVCLNLLLIPRLGLPGAALATAASQVTTAGYIAYRARTHVAFTFPIKPFGIASLGTTAMVVTLVVLPLQSVELVQLIAYPTIGVLIYFPVVLLLGGTTRREIARVVQ